MSEHSLLQCVHVCCVCGMHVLCVTASDDWGTRRFISCHLCKGPHHSVCHSIGIRGVQILLGRKVIQPAYNQHNGTPYIVSCHLQLFHDCVACCAGCLYSRQTSFSNWLQMYVFQLFVSVAAWHHASDTCVSSACIQWTGVSIPNHTKHEHCYGKGSWGIDHPEGGLRRRYTSHCVYPYKSDTTSAKGTQCLVCIHTHLLWLVCVFIQTWHKVYPTSCMY